MARASRGSAWRFSQTNGWRLWSFARSARTGMCSAAARLASRPSAADACAASSRGLT